MVRDGHELDLLCWDRWKYVFWLNILDSNKSNDVVEGVEEGKRSSIQKEFLMDVEGGVGEIEMFRKEFGGAQPVWNCRICSEGKKWETHGALEVCLICLALVAAWLAW